MPLLAYPSLMSVNNTTSAKSNLIQIEHHSIGYQSGCISFKFKTFSKTVNPQNKIERLYNFHNPFLIDGVTISSQPTETTYVRSRLNASYLSTKFYLQFSKEKLNNEHLQAMTCIQSSSQDNKQISSQSQELIH